MSNRKIAKYNAGDLVPSTIEKVTNSKTGEIVEGCLVFHSDCIAVFYDNGFVDLYAEEPKEGGAVISEHPDWKPIGPGYHIRGASTRLHFGTSEEIQLEAAEL